MLVRSAISLGSQLAVFQHRKVRVDLVLAEIEPVPDVIERASEVVSHGCHNTALRYRFLL